jgi:hypothetical protein
MEKKDDYQQEMLNLLVKVVDGSATKAEKEKAVVFITDKYGIKN